MKYVKNINEEITFLESLKALVEIYGEIASVRMIKIRGFVLKNRDFLSSINNIFQDVLASYSRKLSELQRRGKVKIGERITFLAHNGKTVVVLISANTGFYGNIVQETYKKFEKYITNEDVEVTIIGRLGLSLFLSKFPNKQYTYFELPDFGMNAAVLKEITRHLVQYEEIRVYFGKYYSVLNQKPETSSISAGTIVQQDKDKPVVEYIFEPSVEKILMFFETEIFTSLLDQSIRESQLAKFASRIMAMDSATQNIRDRIRETDLERLRVLHSTINSKQLNTLPSIFAGRN